VVIAVTAAHAALLLSANAADGLAQSTWLARDSACLLSGQPHASRASMIPACCCRPNLLRDRGDPTILGRFIYLRGIAIEEIVSTVNARRALMMLRQRACSSETYGGPRRHTRVRAVRGDDEGGDAQRIVRWCCLCRPWQSL